MGTIFGALLFGDDRLGLLIDAEKINPPKGIVPVVELLENDHGFGGNHTDTGAPRPLKIASFLRLRAVKGRVIKTTDLVASEFMKKHQATAIAALFDRATIVTSSLT